MIKQFILNSMITTIMKTFSALLKFLVVIYITNEFGASEYGAFTFAMAIFLFINLIFRYGFDIYTQKESVLFENRKKYLKGISHFFNVTWFSIISIISITAIAELLLFFYKDNLNYLKYTYLSLLLVFGFLYSILWIFTYYFRGIGRGKFSVFNLEILFTIIQIISIFILSKFKLDPYLILIYSFVIAMSFSIFLYYLNIKDRISKLIKVSKVYTPQLSLKYIKSSYPYLIISMSTMILAWSDIFIISYFENNESIGIYSVVTKIGFLILFPSSAVVIFFSNKVVVFLEKKDYLSLKRYFYITTLGLSIVSLVMFLLINYYNLIILNIFGEVFISATTTLLIFTFAQSINGATGIFESLFLMSKYKALFMKLNLGMIFINLILNIPLVYLYGINGAAIATLISVIIIKTIQLVIIKKSILTLSSDNS